MNDRWHFDSAQIGSLAALGVLTLTVMTAVGRAGQGTEERRLPSIEEKTAAMHRHDGFFTFYWDQRRGKVWLEVTGWNEEFLYAQSLATGLGSNPVGLDRGQLGRERVVRFEKVGPKVLLIERNLRFRATSQNAAERTAVEESFAQSVLWGAEVAAETDEQVLVDLTPLLLGDAHDVVGRLKRTGQGTFKLDPLRSAVHLPRTKAFPDNSEFEAMLTFASSEPGPLVRETAPTPQAVTLRQHHSFIRLPDDQYMPRRFDPRAPSFPVTFADYAAPIDEPLQQRWIMRHRLRKQDPQAAVSRAVEPIVYYVDPGAPEPVRSALIDGARWWNAAFEAAGFTSAFRVEILPEGVDPMDVRYNVIQWVHRSTRGWSYGSSVTDPRTGEIIKGHVTLGSLRVRQDRLLMEGLVPRFASSAPLGSCGLHGVAEEASLAELAPGGNAVQVALARIRQLSAHEVGHTLGFAHNFAASTYGRASVMDYPAPRVTITDDGELDLSDAYGVGVGVWDVFAVKYAYSEFPPGSDEQAALEAMVNQANKDGMAFVSDPDARPGGAAHPLGNLWDNGPDPVAELKHVLRVRRIALDRFADANLVVGRPQSLLEEVLVPLYLHHRYQVQATAKLLGGVHYHYAVRGDGREPLRPVSNERQRAALKALLGTLKPQQLAMPQRLLNLLPPMPFGYNDARERFPRRTAMLFDPVTAAEVAAQITVEQLMQHERAARLVAQHDRDPSALGLSEAIERLIEATWQSAAGDEGSVARRVQRVVVDQLIALAGNPAAATEVRAIATAKLRSLQDRLRNTPRGATAVDVAHSNLADADIERFLARPHAAARSERPTQPPPGSPIGER